MQGSSTVRLYKSSCLRGLSVSVDADIVSVCDDPVSGDVVSADAELGSVEDETVSVEEVDFEEEGGFGALGAFLFSKRNT